MLAANRDKFVHIVLPLLRLAAIFIPLYSFVNWLIFASGFVPLDRDVANLWLPAGLGGVAVIATIAPRLRILKLDKDGRLPVFLVMMAGAVIIAPTLCFQTYVKTASGGLTHVTSADRIVSAARTKYYLADDICIDREGAEVRHENTVTGRHNDWLQFQTYVLVPVCATPKGSLWVGLTYQTSVSNTAPGAVKEVRYRDFLKRSQAELDLFEPTSAQFFEALGPSPERRSFEKALRKSSLASRSPVILIPHHEMFQDRNADSLFWGFAWFGILSAGFMILLAFPAVDPQALASAREPHHEGARSEATFWALTFLPNREAYGLAVLLDINIGVFLVMALSGLGVVSFQVDDLRDWGANYGPALQGLGVFRLVTSQFVHGGIMHLMTNLYGLWFAGAFLSPVLKKWGLIASYLACGCGAALASVIVQPAITSVGASGSIMGLLGVLLALSALGERRLAAGRGPMIINCLVFAGLTLFQGALNPGVDNVAHIAGLAVGFSLGVLIRLFSWGERSAHRTHRLPV